MVDLILIMKSPEVNVKLTKAQRTAKKRYKAKCVDLQKCFDNI